MWADFVHNLLLPSCFESIPKTAGASVDVVLL